MGYASEVPAATNNASGQVAEGASVGEQGFVLVVSSTSASSGDAIVGGVSVSMEVERLRKFSITKVLKLYLLQSVPQHDAHCAPHGKSDDLF